MNHFGRRQRSRPICALEIYALVSRQGFLAQSRWFADLFGQFLEQAAAQLPPQERVAAKERGLALDFPLTVASLLRNISGKE